MNFEVHTFSASVTVELRERFSCNLPRSAGIGLREESSKFSGEGVVLTDARDILKVSRSTRECCKKCNKNMGYHKGATEHSKFYQ